jgi:hypothetical protein
VTRALVLAVLLASRLAAADPSDRELVGLGLAMAPPAYVLGVTEHEGSHAIAALLVGAHVDELHLLPGVDPHIDHFRFGWTYVHGLRTRRDQILFYVAPKLTDVAMLGAFAALAFSHSLPGNRYGDLALTVLATGSWVDFSKDVVLFSPHNDVVKLFRLWCFTGWRQIPARVVYAGLAAGLGYAVAQGYEQTFRDRAGAAAAPLVLPLLSSAF